MTTPKTSQFDFSANLRELEEITNWFETDEVDLTQALVKFERGMELVAGLKQHLEQTQNRVTAIKQRFDKPSADDNRATGTAEEPAPDADPALDLFTDK